MRLQMHTIMITKVLVNKDFLMLGICREKLNNFWAQKFINGLPKYIPTATCFLKQQQVQEYQHLSNRQGERIEQDLFTWQGKSCLRQKDLLAATQGLLLAVLPQVTLHNAGGIILGVPGIRQKANHSPAVLSALSKLYWSEIKSTKVEYIKDDLPKSAWVSFTCNLYTKIKR